MRAAYNRLGERDDVVSLRSLFGLHFSEEPISQLSDVLRRHTHPGRRAERLLAFNTYLMDIPAAGRKPAVEFRDKEIGAYTARNFDIVCLSEVWHEEERRDLLKAWPGDVAITHQGGDGGLVNGIEILSSSGLLTISRRLPVIATNFYEFEAESGPDKMPDKGCLLTVYEPQMSANPVESSLFVYNTHMNAEDEDDPYDMTRFQQLLELFAFIDRTKDKPKGDFRKAGVEKLNGIILAGDFNIDRANHQRFHFADTLTEHLDGLPVHLRNAVLYRRQGQEYLVGRTVEKTGYELLRDLAAACGLQDLWMARNGSVGYTYDASIPSVAAVIAKRDGADPRYCDDQIDSSDFASLPMRPQVLDYLFVSSTTEQMDFTMDFTRPRRMYTPRPSGAPDYDDIQWMSDHIALGSDVLLAEKE